MAVVPLWRSGSFAFLLWLMHTQAARWPVSRCCSAPMWKRPAPRRAGLFNS